MALDPRDVDAASVDSKCRGPAGMALRRQLSQQVQRFVRCLRRVRIDIRHDATHAGRGDLDPAAGTFRSQAKRRRMVLDEGQQGLADYLQDYVGPIATQVNLTLTTPDQIIIHGSHLLGRHDVQPV